MNAEKSNVQPAIEGRPLSSWAAALLDYFDAKVRLMAAESGEASRHFVLLLILIGAVLVLSLCGIVMYAAFLLFVIGLIFHLAWGWSALVVGTAATLFSVLLFLWFRIQIRKPVFQMSLKDLQKDREWLSQSRTKAV
jgi:uncharacterized membrane protein YqjE